MFTLQAKKKEQAMPPFDYNRYKRENFIMPGFIIAALALGFGLGYQTADEKARALIHFEFVPCA